MKERVLYSESIIIHCIHLCPFRSEISKPLSGPLPDNISVGTLVSIQTDGRGEDLLPSKHTATSTYADMLEAVNVCNQSKDQKCYIIRWNEVKQFLVSKDKTYEQYSVQQHSYKYKYLKKAKKLLK